MKWLSFESDESKVFILGLGHAIRAQILTPNKYKFLFVPISENNKWHYYWIVLVANEIKVYFVLGVT